MGPDFEVSDNPLQHIIPGESFVLSNGHALVVRPWSARAIVHDIPGILGRLFGKMGAASGTSPELTVSWFMQHAASDLLDIVKYSSGLTEEDVDQISADELLSVAQVVLRQNRSFFARAQDLYRTVKQQDVSGNE